jgi:hypothetical protein
MMSHQQVLQVGITVILVILFLVGCGISAPTAVSEAPAATPEPLPTVIPRVVFTAPADVATVASPVHVTMQAENFIIEPDGEVKQGAGHLHIMVDAECLKPGQDIPKNETHLHYAEGQLEADLNLAPGTHTLCLQAGDGWHTALGGKGMTQKITITVK